MTRKSFAIRHLKPAPPDEETARKYLLHWQSGDLYHAPETFPRISSSELFGNDRPLELEIGSGTGEFLCALAASDPAANFLGVDISLKSVYVAVHKARALDNIKFVKAAIQYIYPLLLPTSLRAIYLHFPDPCLRPKYRDKRVFTPDFLDAAYQALEDGGLISVMTDLPELYDSMLALSRRDPRYETTVVEPYHTGLSPAARSRYQAIWEAKGIVPQRFVAAKVE
jgi:tRNA (guanine-N7-)-methyltransferase